MKRFWNADECAAEMGGMKTGTFLRNYAPRPDFPSRISIPGSRRPLWKASEVIAWIEKYKERH